MTEVLIIDDEPFILHAFRKAFEETEFTLLTASNAAEGLELVGKKIQDVKLVSSGAGAAAIACLDIFVGLEPETQPLGGKRLVIDQNGPDAHQSLSPVS